MQYQTMFTTPKWSLTGETAMALYAIKHQPSRYVGNVKTLEWAIKNSTEFRPTGTFDSFLAVNGIELVD